MNKGIFSIPVYDHMTKISMKLFYTVKADQLNFSEAFWEHITDRHENNISLMMVSTLSKLTKILIRNINY